MKPHHHRIVAYVLAGAIIGAFSVRYIHKRYDPAKEFEQIKIIPHTEPASIKPTQAPPPPVAKTLFLKVPFTPQAPTANWDELHNEACEEASAIMAFSYFKGDTRATLPPDFVEQEITKLTEWENNHLGYHLDINSQETAQLLKEVYGLNVKILTDFTESDIKDELALNHVVILPANGKLLGNPNFRSPGPPYHVIVIKGYDANGFITNDPGTRKGMNYPYTYNTLYNANGNFDHATHEVNLNDKNIIVVWK